MLSESGIKLGNFLSATVSLAEHPKNFQLKRLNLQVTVEGNFAKVHGIEANLEKNADGILVFSTNNFASAKATNQGLEIGRYKITVQAVKPSEKDLFNGMKFFGTVEEKISGLTRRVASNNTNQVIGEGFRNMSISGKRTMKAFVYSTIQKKDLNTYFLWICDKQEKSIFTSKTHVLGLGHFFEGYFEQTPNGKSQWECVKYLKQIDQLIQGDVIRNKVVLRTRVTQYEPATGHRKYPQVYANHLGIIIDNQNKLPIYCNGVQIKTQLCKVGDSFEWVVVEII